MIEAHVRFIVVAVDPLPGDIQAFGFKGGELLNPRLIGRDRRVTDHARLDAGQPGNRALGGAFMAIVRTRQTLRGVDVVRKFDRLDGGRTATDEIARGGREIRPRRTEHLRWIGRRGRADKPAAKRAGVNPRQQHQQPNARSMTHWSVGRQ